MSFMDLHGDHSHTRDAGATGAIVMTSRWAAVCAAIGIAAAPNARADRQLGAAGQRSARQSSFPMVSGVVAVTMPPIAITARRSGSVELRISTNGENVDRVDVERPAQLLTDGAVSFVRGWRFQATEPLTFTSTITFASLTDCAPRFPMQADLEVPVRASITVGDPCVTIVDGPGPRDEVVGPFLRGQVRCACQDHLAIADVTVTLAPEKGAALRTKTASDGTYTFSEIPNGDYRLRFDAEGFSSSWLTQTLRIRRGHQPRSFAVTTLAPDNLAVRALDFPTYPSKAIERNLEGAVHVRAQGWNSVIVDGDPILATSALANVLSWHVTRGSGSPVVTYTYSLIDDCENPNPHVTMKLPFEVNVIGKRRTSCGGSPMKALFHALHGSSW
jgi:hypothetical protein